MQHVVKAPVVKVSIGSPGGNRIARILRAGATVPEGVHDDQLKALVDRGLIEKVVTAGDEMPKASAPAAEWTAYALAVGTDPAVVDKATKAQLVAHFSKGEALPVIEPEGQSGESGAGSTPGGSGDGSGSGDPATPPSE